MSLPVPKIKPAVRLRRRTGLVPVVKQPQVSRAGRMKEFIRRYVIVPEGKFAGKHIQLLPQQVAYIEDVYGDLKEDGRLRTRMGILSTPRKAGKTGTAAAIIQAHIYGPEAKPNSNVYSAAQSRDQASLVFNYAAKSIRFNKELQDIVHIRDSQKMIIGLARNVVYKALAREAATTYGLNPSCVVHDEVGQIVGPVDAFFDALETAGAAQEEPISHIISTQAPTDADLLSILIDDGLQDPTRAVKVHLYCAPPDADIFDEEVWGACNYALTAFGNWDEFRNMARRAKGIPSFEATFRNLCLNQRVSQTNKFVSPSLWKENNRPVNEDLFYSLGVSVGLDLSQKTDLTAAVLCVVDENLEVHLKTFAFTPEAGLLERAKRDRAPYHLWVEQGHLIAVPGSVVSYPWVVEFLIRETKGMEIVEVNFDRWRIETFKSEAEAQGWGGMADWKEVGQGYKDMSPRVEAFEVLLMNRQIHHGNNPVMNLGISGAVTVMDPAGSRKLEKSKSTARIDALQAALMSIPVIIQGREPMMVFSA